MSELHPIAAVGESPEKIKKMVKEKYGEIAVKAPKGQAGTKDETGCCGPGCCGDGTYSVFQDDYSKLQGYNPDADLGLGCGVPTEFAKIEKGNTVVDLGSGAGNDAFVVRSVLGETGQVIGVDMTEQMVEKARQNTAKLGYKNVKFVLGEIENLPLGANSADVVISNCVLNLVPDKTRAYSEVYRVLKPGAHFSISDVVTSGELPEKIRTAAEMYAGCVAGAMKKEDYLGVIARTGFKNVSVVKEKPVAVPDETLRQYLSEAELTEYKQSGKGIYSITVYAEK
ncbi:MAG: arsenite methyltransferase [Ignavibacteriae bacterium]|nr:arsenite methyltransferase [Ignavibacteriota bacterium]